MKKIESEIIEFLNGSDLGIPSYGEVPKNPPSEYFIVELTGGGNTDHINESTIAIKSHAKTRARAAELIYQMDERLRYGLIESDYVSKVHRNTIANFTDLSTKTYRYQGVYVVTHY